jgi:hypothetical protein
MTPSSDEFAAVAGITSTEATLAKAFWIRSFFSCRLFSLLAIFFHWLIFPVSNFLLIIPPPFSQTIWTLADSLYSKILSKAIMGEKRLVRIIKTAHLDKI